MNPAIIASSGVCFRSRIWNVSSLCTFRMMIYLQFVFHRARSIILAVMVANEEFPSLLEKRIQDATTMWCLSGCKPTPSAVD